MFLAPCLPKSDGGSTENMHYFVSETARMEVGSVGGFTKKARAIYDENLGAYVKLLFRRPFGKIIVSLQPLSLSWQ